MKEEGRRHSLHLLQRRGHGPVMGWREGGLGTDAEDKTGEGAHGHRQWPP